MTAKVKHKMYMLFLFFSGVVSIGTAGILAQLPPASQLEEVGKWPITIALIALAGWSVWLMYRQAENSRLTSQDISNSLRDLTKELVQRPCIRAREND